MHKEIAELGAGEREAHERTLADLDRLGERIDGLGDRIGGKLDGLCDQVATLNTEVAGVLEHVTRIDGRLSKLETGDS